MRTGLLDETVVGASGYLSLSLKKVRDLVSNRTVQHAHLQTYDSYWRHGSVCEEEHGSAFSAVPILSIGGWHDGYRDAALRLARDWPHCRALVGPWSHEWPDTAVPGPNVSNKQKLKLKRTMNFLCVRSALCRSAWTFGVTISSARGAASRRRPRNLLGFSAEGGLGQVREKKSLNGLVIHLWAKSVKDK